MKFDYFQQRKDSILNKKDKSSKGNWDEKIIKLCNKINLKKNYYTTSSCSGRIVLMYDEVKKDKNLFIKTYHNLVDFNQLKKDLNNIKSNKLIKFKQEPCILHIAFKNLKDFDIILEKTKLAGFKKVGLISTKKRYVVEISSTEKLEFPIKNKNKILVNDSFLNLIIKISNNNLKKSWKKIDELLFLI
jgi:tRNA wybutosine-synthesizing protein 3